MIPVQVFDTQGEYADILASALPGQIEAFRFADFRRDAFQGPPNRSLAEWLYCMSDYMRGVFFYRDGVINLFRDTCSRVLDAGEQLNALTFATQFQKTSQNARRASDYFESLKRFKYMLELPTYRCASGFDLARLAKRPVVFDLSRVPDDVRLFFVADLVAWHEASREYKRQRGLELVFVFDELSKFVNKEAAKRSDLREPYLLELLRSSRKKGIGAILADQTYALFHEVIRSNCLTKVVFETGDGPSRFEIARDFSLGREEEAFLNQLSFQSQRRTVLVQIPQLPEPFLVEVPEFQMPKRESSYQPPDLEWTPLAQKTDGGEAAREADPDVVITHEMEQYLGIIGSRPLHKETDYDEMAKKPQARGTRLRRALIEAGLVEEHEIDTHKQGGRYKVVVPTEAGYELMDAKRIPHTRPPGNGSILHRFWQYSISRKLRWEGWNTRVEQSLMAKRVDVGAVKGRLRAAYEVSLEPLDKELINLEKDLADGWNRVVFCVETQEIQERLSGMLPDSEDRVEIRLLRDFL